MMQEKPAPMQVRAFLIHRVAISMDKQDGLDKGRKRGKQEGDAVELSNFPT